MTTTQATNDEKCNCLTYSNNEIRTCDAAQGRLRAASYHTGPASVHVLAGIESIGLQGCTCFSFPRNIFSVLDFVYICLCVCVCVCVCVCGCICIEMASRYYQGAQNACMGGLSKHFEESLNKNPSILETIGTSMLRGKEFGFIAEISPLRKELDMHAYQVFEGYARQAYTRFHTCYLEKMSVDCSRYCACFQREKRNIAPHSSAFFFVVLPVIVVCSDKRCLLLRCLV
jgi:hypothetical protein